MSFTTSRIASNVTTHGVHFAVKVEIARALRLGRSEQAAITWAVEQVRAAIGHAGLRK